MEHLHDPYRHLSYLRQSLSQDTESIGFFLSAGCPLSVQMPDSTQWPLIPDMAGLTKSIGEKLKDNPDYQQLISELNKTNKSSSNIEHLLSFLRSLQLVAEGGEVRGFNFGQLEKLETQICSHIVKKIGVELPQANTPYHRLAKWINSIERKKAIEVFTTNYDLLMEQALEELQVPYFDGFVGARKPFFDLKTVEDDLAPKHWSRLWKIHGSINWQMEKSKDSTRKGNVYRTSTPEDGSSHLIYPSHLKYEESRKMPYLALIDKLSQFIRRKSSILVLCGYSFSDDHLNDAIISALKSNPTAMVLGLMFGEFEDKTSKKPSYPKAFELAKNRPNLSIWASDKAIIGTNEGKWASMTTRPENMLSHFVLESPNSTSGALKHLTLELGDFNVFTQFLQNTIGLRDENE